METKIKEKIKLVEERIEKLELEKIQLEEFLIPIIKLGLENIPRLISSDKPFMVFDIKSEEELNKVIKNFPIKEGFDKIEKYGNKDYKISNLTLNLETDNGSQSIERKLKYSSDKIDI